MLTELGKEQKFEVTYVEVEEKTDEDLTQCLVQLSTLPVAVRKYFNNNKINSLVNLGCIKLYAWIQILSFHN